MNSLKLFGRGRIGRCEVSLRQSEFQLFHLKLLEITV